MNSRCGPFRNALAAVAVSNDAVRASACRLQRAAMPHLARAGRCANGPRLGEVEARVRCSTMRASARPTTRHRPCSFPGPATMSRWRANRAPSRMAWTPGTDRSPVRSTDPGRRAGHPLHCASRASRACRAWNPRRHWTARSRRQWTSSSCRVARTPRRWTPDRSVQRTRPSTGPRSDEVVSARWNSTQIAGRKFKWRVCRGQPRTGR